jgi:hypothetical protein
MAMNQLCGFAIVETGLGLLEFAWRVFGAFDEGEYVHDGLSPRNRVRPALASCFVESILSAVPDMPLQLTAPGRARARPSRSVLS